MSNVESTGQKRKTFFVRWMIASVTGPLHIFGLPVLVAVVIYACIGWFPILFFMSSGDWLEAAGLGVLWVFCVRSVKVALEL